MPSSKTSCGAPPTSPARRRSAMADFAAISAPAGRWPVRSSPTPSTSSLPPDHGFHGKLTSPSSHPLFPCSAPVFTRLPSGEEGEALSAEKIKKAYLEQSRLRHPDKLRDDPGATADFQGLHNSYNLLSDESLRRQFDARLYRWEENRVAADLDRELEDFFARNKFIPTASASTWAHGDNKGGTSDNGTQTDKEKVLKVSWEGGADYYTAAKLNEIFNQLGEVEDIMINTRKSKRKGSAIVAMASKEAAREGGFNEGY